MGEWNFLFPSKNVMMDEEKRLHGGKGWRKKSVQTDMWMDVKWRECLILQQSYPHSISHTQPVFALTHSFKKRRKAKKNEWITQTLMVLPIFFISSVSLSAFLFQIFAATSECLLFHLIPFRFLSFSNPFSSHILATSYQYWNAMVKYI